MGRGASGSVRAVEISLAGKRSGLVEENPILHAIPECASDECRVVGETSRDVAIGPTASIFESLRKIPVIERHERANLGFE